MSTQLQPSPDTMQPTPNAPKHSTRDRIIAGIALIAIGAVVFLAQISNQPELTWVIVPVLGLIFLIWGLAARTYRPDYPWRHPEWYRSRPLLHAPIRR